MFRSMIVIGQVLNLHYSPFLLSFISHFMLLIGYFNAGKKAIGLVPLVQGIT